VSSGDPRIDLETLRQRLRALGYLNAGVDRFLLAPARRDVGAVGLAWRVSTRIGLLAALLLGPAAAIGIASRLPGLISGARDAIVVTLYLAIVFGAAAALLSWAAALAARAVAHRARPGAARRIGIATGTIAAVACLAYLTLWWGTTAGTVWSSPVRTIVALAAAVAVSLLLGHAVATATLALLAREPGTQVRAPLISWRATLLLSAIAFVGASGILALAATSAEPQPQPSDFVVVPTGLRVVVVGVDGWNPSLLRTGPDVDLPHLRRLARRTAVAAGSVDTDPARVWTTIATGVAPEAHGVSGVELRQVTGVEGSFSGASSARSTILRSLASVTDLVRLTRPAAVSGTVRRHKAFWDVAAEKGLDVAVVNWWATWPATNTRATVISDRAALRLEQGGAQSAEIAPESVYPPLRARWPDIVREADRLAASRFRDVEGNAERGVLLRSARIDAQAALVARDPLLGAPDLLAVYLPGLDIAQHTLLLEGNTPGADPAALAARLEAVRRYYLFLDGLIGRLTAGLPDHTILMIVTHPGRAGGVRPTVSVGGATVVDMQSAPDEIALEQIAPTVLYLAGLPVSDELAGEPLLEFFSDAVVKAHPVRRVASYGRYDAYPPSSRGAPLDEEALERLRSLGYIR
jgi:hypothetical protein